MSKEITFRIRPALSGLKKSWQLERVEGWKDETQKVATSVGYFPTLKAAKEAAAHLARKPIKLPHKITV